MVNKIKKASLLGALVLSMGMLVSAPGYTHGGHGGGGWHGGGGHGWHGGGGHGWHGGHGWNGGWRGAGWGGGRWNNAGWFGGIGVLPVVAPWGYNYRYNNYNGYYYNNGCFVPGHRNARGMWISAHYRC